MHYYKRNLGDYAKKTGRLSMLQHGAYTLLLDACYDRERFPTLDDAIDWAWASTTEEIEAVKFVLSRFFTLKDGVYVQDRIWEEIESYRQKALTNKRIATEREASRRDSSTNRARTVHEAPPNQEPITTNQEPITKEKTARIRALAPSRPDDVDEQTWDDWLALRKSKRSPVTETVIRGARAESEKAQMSLQAFLRVWCTRGSQWLQADWLRPDERPSRGIVDIGRITVPGPSGPDPTLAKIEEDRKRAVPIPENVREAMKALSRKPAHQG